MIRRLCWLAACCLVAVPAAAQTPNTAARSAAYDAAGRRDPFVSLVTPRAATRAAASAAPVRRGPGLAGVAIADVVVKGVIRSGTTMIALLAAPDGRTFMAHRQDRLADGVVSRIEADGVVFSERSADVAGVARARDVRKPLRTMASGGER